MPPVRQEDALQALKTVRDPQSGKPVMEAGLVQGLSVRDNRIDLVMEVPPSAHQRMEPLRKACEEALAGLPGVGAVNVVLTAHSDPPEKKPPPAAGRAAPPKPAPQPLPGIKNVIAVASGKGGVGKSTLAVNLALAFAQSGKKTGILDADIYGPSIPRMMGLTGKPQTSPDKKIIPMERYGLKTMSIGYLVDEKTAMIWRGPMVQSALSQMIADVEWGVLDVLVIDMPPGTGDAQLTIVQKIPLAGAIIVSTPQEIALIDAQRAVAMFSKTRVPVLGIVENMAHFTAPDSGEKTYIFGKEGARRLAGQMEVPFLGEIALIPAIREGMDKGEPVVACAPNSHEAATFARIARALITTLDSIIE